MRPFFFKLDLAMRPMLTGAYATDVGRWLCDRRPMLTGGYAPALGILNHESYPKVQYNIFLRYATNVADFLSELSCLELRPMFGLGRALELDLV